MTTISFDSVVLPWSTHPSPGAVRWPRRRGGRGDRWRARRSGGRRRVALRLDAGPHHLEVEGTLEPGVEHHGKEALERDVAVAGDRPVAGLGGADDVVGDLGEPDEVDVAADDVLEAPLVPARLEVEHDLGAGPAGEVHRVALPEDEADTEPIDYITETALVLCTADPATLTGQVVETQPFLRQHGHLA
jgi:hypothetical protein